MNRSEVVLSRGTLALGNGQFLICRFTRVHTGSNQILAVVMVCVWLRLRV